MADEGLVPLRNALAEATSGLGLGNALATGALWRRWAEIVGLDVAGHAEPTSLKDGVLRIRADSPVWASEIGYLAEDLRARINQALGAPLVTQVVVWTGPGRPRIATARARPPDAAPAPDADPSVAPLEAFARAQAAWRRRRSSGPRKGPS